MAHLYAATVHEDNEPWLEYSESGDCLAVVLHAPKRLDEMLGENTLARFYGAFMGADRLMSLAHLVNLNQAAFAVLRATGSSVDEHAHYRNGRVLVFTLAGAAHEMGKALNALSVTARCLRDPSTWEPLDEFRRRWYTNPLASKIRNGFAFHHGKPDVYRAGISHPNAPASELLYIRDGQTSLAGKFQAPWEALYRGEDLNFDDTMTRFEGLDEFQGKLPLRLMDFFIAVLCEHKIEVRKTDRDLQSPW